MRMRMMPMTNSWSYQYWPGTPNQYWQYRHRCPMRWTYCPDCGQRIPAQSWPPSAPAPIWMVDPTGTQAPAGYNAAGHAAASV